MIAAIRAEFTKMLTTRMWWLLLVVLIVYVAFTAAILAAAFGGLLPGAEQGPQIPGEQLAPVIYSIASTVGYVFPLLLGTLAVTSEFRHQTLTPTFLATPQRGRVLVAKAITMALFGALYGLGALVGTVLAGAGILGASNGETGLGESDIWLLFARTVLAMALWAVIGVGVGSIVPNQVAAIVIVLAFTQFVEPIFRTLAVVVDWAAEVGKYLPGAASDALVGASIFTILNMGGGESALLEWWQGALVLGALAIVTAVIGYLTSWRKDIT